MGYNKTRIGPDIRNGLDIAPEHLLDVFKFRSCEFGNWMSRADRRWHLNSAFEAFMDLAFALRAPLDFLSLGGYQGNRLAIAFGVYGRGKGNWAHYDYSSVVINLTKSHGAGTLAHEWAHAFDNFLNVKCNATGRKPFLSGSYSHAEQYPEIAEAMMEVMDAIKKAPLEFDVEVARQKERIDYLKNRYLRDLVEILVKDFRRNQLEESITTIERLKERVINSVDRNSLDMMVKLYRKAASSLARKGELISSIYGVIDLIKSKQFELEELMRKSKAGITLVKDSYYYDSAKALDGGNVGQEYSAPWELFARAFEAFVDDELGARGISNRYLVQETIKYFYTVGSDVYTLFPVKGDRRRINERMRKLVDLAIHEFGLDGHRANFSVYENFGVKTGGLVMGNDVVATTEKNSKLSDRPEVKNQVSTGVHNDVQKTEKGNGGSKKGVSGREGLRSELSNIGNELLPGILVTSLENTYSLIKDAVQTKLKYGVVVEGKVPIEVSKGKTKCWTSSNGVVTIDSGGNTVRRLGALLEVIALVKALGKTAKKPEVGMVAEGIEFIMRYKLGLPVENYLKAKEFDGLSRKEKDMTAYIGLCRTLCNEIVTQTGLKELFR